MCDGDEIRVEHLPEHIADREPVDATASCASGKTEREVIEEALRAHHGNRVRVADELGMHRSTLWRKIKTYGISE